MHSAEQLVRTRSAACLFFIIKSSRTAQIISYSVLTAQICFVDPFVVVEL